MRCAGPGKQEAQVVVDLGHGADSRARVVAGGFLLDGNGGRQALNQVHIGLVHALQKLPCIGREAFHIAALPFGIQRVKGQAGFARARQASDHHQLVARDVDVDIFQVMGARTSHTDLAERAPSTQVVAQIMCVGRRIHGSCVFIEGNPPS